MISSPRTLLDAKMQTLKPKAGEKEGRSDVHILLPLLFCLTFCDTSPITLSLCVTSKHSFLQMAYPSSEDRASLFKSSTAEGVKFSSVAIGRMLFKNLSL